MDDGLTAIATIELADSQRELASAMKAVQLVKGVRGEPGKIGPVGPQGETIIGPAGADGRDGKDGAPGIRGERGPSGPAGNDGKDGIGPDEKVRVSGDDPTAGFLTDKVTAGFGIGIRTERGERGERLIIDTKLQSGGGAGGGGPSGVAVYDDGVGVGFGSKLSFDGGAPVTISAGLIHVPVGGGGGGSDDQTAAEVPFTPAGSISATDVQAAIEEVAAAGSGIPQGGPLTQDLDAGGFAILNTPQTVYVQATDPGAVGTGKLWIDTTLPDGSAQAIRWRNEADDQWFDFFKAYTALGPLEMRTGPAAPLRLRQRDGDGNVRAELIFDQSQGRADLNIYDAIGTMVATWEVGEDGLGGSVYDELGNLRAGHLAEAGASDDADATWEWTVKNAAGTNKAQITLNELGFHVEAEAASLDIAGDTGGAGDLFTAQGDGTALWEPAAFDAAGAAAAAQAAAAADATTKANAAQAAAIAASGPATVDYLVGTASGGLSAEIVVGASPGGELGGTWASPTVDASHSGSTHAATQAAAEATAASALSTHAGAADPHPGYLTATEGDAAYQPKDSDLTAIAALTTTAFARALLTTADAAAVLAALSLDADLASLALPASTTISAFGASLIDDAAASNARATLGLGTAATSASTDFQPLDADLTFIAALSTTAFGRGLLALADPADGTKFLDGTGAFSVPTGGLTQPQVMARSLGC